MSEVQILTRFEILLCAVLALECIFSAWRSIYPHEKTILDAIFVLSRQIGPFFELTSKFYVKSEASRKSTNWDSLNLIHRYWLRFFSFCKDLKNREFKIIFNDFFIFLFLNCKFIFSWTRGGAVECRALWPFFCFQPLSFTAPRLTGTKGWHC